MITSIMHDTKVGSFGFMLGQFVGATISQWHALSIYQLTDLVGEV